MKTINAGLLGIKGEFSSYKETGTNFYRYMHYTYENMKKRPGNVKLQKIEPEMIPALGKGLSILLGTEFINLEKFDVVHNFDLNPFFPIRKGRAKIITTAHDFQLTLAPQYNRGLNKSLKYRLFIGTVNKLAVRATLESDHIIAVSTSTRDDCVKLGFDRKRITIVNHGVDRSFFKQMPKKDGKKFVVGYLGVMAPRKNPTFLIKTFRLLEGSEYSFHVWGKLGYDREQIIASAGNDKRIHFDGFAPDDRFVGIYDSFDVFLFPSFYEGFGIPIIEAQARGLPVIIYKNGRIPKETRKHCFEAKDADDAAQMIENFKRNGYNEKQRRRAMLYARSFTWEKTAAETLDVYRRVADTGV